MNYEFVSECFEEGTPRIVSVLRKLQRLRILLGLLLAVGLQADSMEPIVTATAFGSFDGASNGGFFTATATTPFTLLDITQLQLVVEVDLFNQTWPGPMQFTILKSGAGIGPGSITGWGPGCPTSSFSVAFGGFTCSSSSPLFMLGPGDYTLTASLQVLGGQGVSRTTGFSGIEKAWLYDPPMAPVSASAVPEPSAYLPVGLLAALMAYRARLKQRRI